jgi:hypothetical protein
LIVLEFRQLPSSEHNLVAHEQRRIDFGIAVLIGVEVEHELPDRALQPCEALLENDKARARQLCCGFKVHQAEAGTEIIVWFWRESVIARGTEHVMLHIAMLIDAVGHLVEWQIGNCGQLFGKFLVCRLCRRFKLRHRGLELGHLSHQCSGSRVVLGPLGIADFFRSGIAPRLRLLGG